MSAYPVGPLHMNNIVSIIVDYDRAPKGIIHSSNLSISASSYKTNDNIIFTFRLIQIYFSA